MTRCPEGHFYDPARHTACPWCALPADSGPGAQKTRPMAAADQKTRAMPTEVSSPAPPVPRAPLNPGPPPLPGGARPELAPNPPPLPAGAPPTATVRVGAGAKASLKDGPVVGWLVCLEGPDRGRDYRLHMEKNFIGRAPHMDVVIENDSTVSRDKHAVVIFDPKKKIFWALPGEASGLVYLNGDIVNSPTRMEPDDVIEVGQTRLVLIPFCGDRYSWSADSAAAPSSEAPS